METCKCKKEDQNDPAIKLKKQWKDRGIVIMNSDFTAMSQNLYNFLLQKVQNMDDPELVEGEAYQVAEYIKVFMLTLKLNVQKPVKNYCLGQETIH